MVALDRESGETVWMSESLLDSTAYVSPLLIRQDHWYSPIINCNTPVYGDWVLYVRHGNTLMAYDISANTNQIN